MSLSVFYVLSHNLWGWPVIAFTQVSVLVMCHTRELAFQISKEYERFSKYMPSVKVRRQLYNSRKALVHMFKIY